MEEKKKTETNAEESKIPSGKQMTLDIFSVEAKKGLDESIVGKEGRIKEIKPYDGRYGDAVLVIAEIDGFELVRVFNLRVYDGRLVARSKLNEYLLSKGCRSLKELIGKKVVAIKELSRDGNVRYSFI